MSEEAQPIYTSDGSVPGLSFYEFPKWHCPTHGDIGNMYEPFGIATIADSTFCVKCILDKLEELGLKPIERVK